MSVEISFRDQPLKVETTVKTNINKEDIVAETKVETNVPNVENAAVVTEAKATDLKVYTTSLIEMLEALNSDEDDLVDETIDSINDGERESLYKLEQISARHPHLEKLMDELIDGYKQEAKLSINNQAQCIEQLERLTAELPRKHKRTIAQCVALLKLDEGSRTLVNLAPIHRLVAISLTLLEESPTINDYVEFMMETFHGDEEEEDTASTKENDTTFPTKGDPSA